MPCKLFTRLVSDCSHLPLIYHSQNLPSMKIRKLDKIYVKGRFLQGYEAQKEEPEPAPQGFCYVIIILVQKLWNKNVHLVSLTSSERRHVNDHQLANCYKS